MNRNTISNSMYKLKIFISHFFSVCFSVMIILLSILLQFIVYYKIQKSSSSKMFSDILLYELSFNILCFKENYVSMKNYLIFNLI